MECALVVMAKYPEPGKAKTRLCPPLTANQAATLYEEFLLRTLQVARSVPNVALFVAFAPIERADYFRRIAPDFEALPQEGNDLGERLDNALRALLARGHDGVILLGSDVPTLPPGHLAVAIDLLGKTDVVLGPCEDGGYYLLGSRDPQPRLLREVLMSTPRVLADTLALAAEQELNVGFAPPWYDVDTIEDLVRMQDGRWASAL